MTHSRFIPRLTLSRARFSLLALLAAGVPLPPRAGAADPDKAAESSLRLVIEGPVTPALAPVAADLVRRFYEDYPKLLTRFDQPGKPAPRRIRIRFDAALDIPAHCSGDTVTVGVKWLTAHPGDTALLTHELTHAVQQYPQPNPGWLTEGIADYARYLYGPKNQPDWSLPERFRPGQHYTEGYRTTARFLLWVEEKHPGTIDQLHRLLQAGTWKPDAFEAATGKSADELWKSCLAELRAR